MRRFAGLLILVGVLTAAAGPLWARGESERRYQVWLAEDSEDKVSFEPGETRAAIRRLERQIFMMERGLRPAWTVASPWPLVGMGAAVSAFGVLLLAIRRPG